MNPEHRPRWLEGWVQAHPHLEPAVERWLAAAAAVRELAAEAFVGPPEPPHPEGASLEARLSELERLAGQLAEAPSRELATACCRLVAELESESYFLAPTRATSGPVARGALMQAVSLAREAWGTLQEQAQRAGAELPWRLILATHVPIDAPWDQVRLAGNAVAGLPGAAWPWGERCALTGRWWQEDGTGELRFRDLETAFFALAPKAWAAFQRLRHAVTRLAEQDPQGGGELLLGFPELADAFVPEASSATFAALGLASPPSLAAALNNALVRFAHRPLFAKVWEGTWLPYCQVRQLALGLAKALQDSGLKSGDRVAVAFASPGFATYLVDFACVFAGLVSVGLDPTWPPDHALEVLRDAQVAAAVGDREGLEQLAGFSGPRLSLGEEAPGCQPLFPAALPEGWRSASGVGPATPVVLAEDWPENAEAWGLVSDPPGSLYTVVFTSGSTGKPKGIPITRQRMRRQEFQAFLWPLVIASFQPYALLADRRAVWQAVMCGGRVGFCRRGTELWEDLRRLAPTYLEGPPALFQPLVAAYQRALHDGAPVAELAKIRLSLRQRLGGRVAAVAVGGAPVPPQLPPLLSSILQAPVQEAYGATEVGTIAQGGRVRPGLEVRLVDHPELGFTSQDRPFPRGELAVKLSEDQASALAGRVAPHRLTQDGFYLTGDLVELGPEGQVRVLGRVGELVKLTDGRFILPAEAEAACLATGLAQQVALLTVQGHPRLVVVPAPDSEPATVVAGIRRAWATAVPHRPCPEILVDTSGAPWSADNGLATASGKPNRAALARYYATQRVDTESATPPPAATAHLPMRVAEILGKPANELDPKTPLSEQGLDSLGAAEILALADARGISLTPEALRTWPLEELVRFLDGSSEATRPSHPSEEPGAIAVVPRSLEHDLQVEVLRVPLPQVRPPFTAHGLTVLTGGTGFLGVHLLARLAADPPAEGPVVALVRGRDDTHARQRLVEALRTAGLAEVPVGAWGDAEAPVWAVPCHLAEPNLGLEPPLYTRLAAETAVIVHAAASVHHQASFAELRADNVEPVRHLLRLAVTTRLKAFHLVSTLDVTRLAWALGQGNQEEAPLPPVLGAPASQAGGYVLTKWVAERMVELVSQHLEGTWPVVVSRPGLISWSSATGFASLKEWFPALFASCIQLGVVPSRVGAAFPSEPVLTETSARGVQPLPVDFVSSVLARLTSALLSAAAQGKALSVRLNLVNTNPGTNGLMLWPQAFAGLRAAHLAAGADKPLAAVRWPDFRDLCLAEKTAFAPLVPSFAELPALPRFPAKTMQAFVGDEEVPAWNWDRFLPFLQWLKTHGAQPEG